MRLLPTRGAKLGTLLKARSLLQGLVYASAWQGVPGSSQGSFVGSRFHTTPHVSLKMLVRPSIAGSSLQAD